MGRRRPYRHLQLLAIALVLWAVLGLVERARERPAHELRACVCGGTAP